MFTGQTAFVRRFGPFQRVSGGYFRGETGARNRKDEMMTEIVDLSERRAEGDEGFRLSGSEAQHGDTEFWGKYIFSSGGKAHFFIRGAVGYSHLCNGQGYPAFMGNGQCPIFYAGNYPRCKRCISMLAKPAPAPEREG